MPEYKVVLEVAHEDVYYVEADSVHEAKDIVLDVAEEDGLDVIDVKLIEIAEDPDYEDLQD